MSRSIKAPAPVALLNEALTPLQFWLLLAQSASLARAPRGRGERVLVWPGFGAGNASTVVLRRYLEFLGYRTEGWSQGVTPAGKSRSLMTTSSPAPNLSAIDARLKASELQEHMPISSDRRP